jgi:cutinase
LTKPTTRHTNIPQNFGSSVGPSLASALEKSLGADGVAVQGVDYTASIASNAQMGSGGGPVMADLVKQAKANCPDTKIALSGYSQGGFVVSNAISKQGVNPDDIAAAVVYGDPSRQAAGGLDESKVKSFCVSGDGVCSGTFAITAAHLAYTRFVDSVPLFHRNPY